VERHIVANGVRTHLIDRAGDGPVLVLAPGLTANAHSFDEIVAGGLASAVRTLAFDLRGRGLSDKPDSGYDLADHAADIIGALDVLEIDKVVMGGHSYGGLLSLWMASAHPERVAGVVALDPPAQVNEEVRSQIQPSLGRLKTAYPSFQAYLTAMRAMPFFDGWWDPKIEAYYRADVEDFEDGVRPRSKPEHIDAVLEGCVKVDWEATQKAVAKPTLLIRAAGPFGPPGSPAILPADQAALITSRVPDITMVELEANHMTMLFGEPAKQAAAAILEFIEGL